MVSSHVAATAPAGRGPARAAYPGGPVRRGWPGGGGRVPGGGGATPTGGVVDLGRPVANCRFCDWAELHVRLPGQAADIGIPVVQVLHRPDAGASTHCREGRGSTHPEGMYRAAPAVLYLHIQAHVNADGRAA